MKILGLVPARGGSVRVPQKNLQIVGGISLVARAVRCGLDSGVCNWVAVSTDNAEIEAEASKAGAILIVRPKELATEQTPMMPVVRHAVGSLSECDAIVLLQPTSPLRTPADIVACVDLLQSNGADSVVSVVDGGDDVAYHMRHARRLEKIPNVVIPNGAVYVLRTSALLAGEDWFSGQSYAYRMPKDRSIDIDTAADLAFARMMVGNAE